MRGGIVESRDELTLLDNADAADPSLTQLVASGVSGSLPAGPELRERPPMSPENTRRALDVRNRVATLLVDRMGLVRSAALFVFRNQPDIAREAGSAFERRRRARGAPQQAQHTRQSPCPPVATNLVTPNNGAPHA